MIKSAGTTKAEMRNYSLPELQHRHREVVENYETRAKDGIRKAIKAGQILSPYVLDKEEEEFKHVPDLEIVSTTANVANPFHGILQSSKKTFSICLTRPIPSSSQYFKRKRLSNLVATYFVSQICIYRGKCARKADQKRNEEQFILLICTLATLDHWLAILK